MGAVCGSACLVTRHEDPDHVSSSPDPAVTPTCGGRPMHRFHPMLRLQELPILQALRPARRHVWHLQDEEALGRTKEDLSQVGRAVLGMRDTGHPRKGKAVASPRPKNSGRLQLLEGVSQMDVSSDVISAGGRCRTRPVHGPSLFPGPAPWNVGAPPGRGARAPGTAHGARSEPGRVVRPRRRRQSLCERVDPAFWRPRATDAVVAGCDRCRPVGPAKNSM